MFVYGLGPECGGRFRGDAGAILGSALMTLRRCQGLSSTQTIFGSVLGSVSSVSMLHLQSKVRVGSHHVVYVAAKMLAAFWNEFGGNFQPHATPVEDVMKSLAVDGAILGTFVLYILYSSARMFWPFADCCTPGRSCARVSRS
eukprot:TRINITY_DN10763_c0_g1_i1.p1 TRINITY_DN10763_c0_g1~~TRINITY_DN10763_c0_g1_i1.p1  ORF type:complete len:143 (-),score=8.51 TRINITY_DN10763_c0_g1_i1:258-686(-)